MSVKIKCHDFHRQLADWTCGRLPVENGEAMARHAMSCRSCGEEAELERSLRKSFETVAPIARTPDLWERIEARVENTRQPRFVLPFQLQRTFALGGALAAGMLLVFVGFPRQGVNPSSEGGRPALVSSTSSKPGILEQIHTIRLTDTDPAAGDGETTSADAAHLLLVGGPGR
jgi:hypothetical protein